ncbi:MAG TPA: quinone-dependent dihydroorotate dehydrogenase [Bacteroidales bacterium]|jgi:dihydroorotate dehydrogenase|nr:quinone-dependent dihydroorotate dehydrogenase [Bacteroidales bacterium]MCZ2417465.1 quinone-dependent dihydroorotate dehydrogenase [Burkholderiales bacterium]OQC57826.1 MAG: Dihydroorotate dehydrogenase (quinone) [Bacteroidetes bacterium ADurb.Bin013]MBP8999415.1 quinone-dependent dihydroorotate dehydrogenase [Bacteroidales bacterium]MBV6455691.1 Dihydroorotate dehydrogenase (quinone) [Bacteroidales bacterium]
MYRIIRPLLFLFPPETAHNLAFKALAIVKYIPLGTRILRSLFSYNSPSLQRQVMGIDFPNPVGLAAGLDKKAEVYNEMGALGFGFVEIGSVTVAPQEGNPKPRSFRLVKDRALINRMGINNPGVKQIVRNIQQNKPRVIIGGNITKNTSTPNDQAYKDLEKAFAQMYDYVDYFVVNVSCPNVKDLRSLQTVDNLTGITRHLTEIRRYSDVYRPILLKVSPDLSTDVLDQVIELILLSGLDGVVACNTTVSREGLMTGKEKLDAIGEGGLSGAPLKEKVLSVIRYIHEKTEGNLPIIGVGGIMTPQDAKDMLDAGASLVQVYTGFIYEGPCFARKILKYIS